jgi:hypothetical protein
MMQSFNQTIDHSLSFKGLAWRIEAWRTGRPFAEVVLLHTLRFRVEQLFLIHRDTGLFSITSHRTPPLFTINSWYPAC